MTGRDRDGTPSSSAAPGIALIKGGGMGIGRAIALRLARDGWAVAVNDVESARAAAVAGEVVAAGARAAAVVADVGDRRAAGRMAVETTARGNALRAARRGIGAPAVTVEPRRA